METDKEGIRFADDLNGRGNPRAPCGRLIAAPTGGTRICAINSNFLRRRMGWAESIPIFFQKTVYKVNNMRYNDCTAEL